MLPLLEEEAHGLRLEPKVRFPQSKPWDEESHTTDGLIASSQKHHQVLRNTIRLLRRNQRI